jgi:prepilin-type N-terminal cleavage/methylation domain-containing protein
MRTSTTTENRGYTLLEVLMVLFIIGLSLGAVLSLGLTGPARDPAARLDRFAQEYRLMAQSAVLEARHLGLEFFVCRDTSSLCWRWLEQSGREWRPLRELPEGIESDGATGMGDSRFGLVLDGVPLVPEPALRLNPVAGKPQAFVYATRETTAFSLCLNDGEGSEACWQVDGMGRSGSDAALQAPP